MVIRKLMSLSKHHFVLGVVLYNGKEIISFGDRLVVAPISTLCA